MIRLLASAVIILATAAGASAFNIIKKNDTGVLDYKAWADTAGVAREVDGIALFYPETTNETVTINGAIDVPGRSASQIFLGALNYAIDNLDKEDEHEALGEIEPSEQSFTLRLYTKQGSNNTEVIVTRLVRIKALDGRMAFTVSEIDIKHRERGVIPRTQAIEKLNPANNNRHRELVGIAVEAISRYIDTIARAASESSDFSVSHWKEIQNHEVVKGMNPFEVKLSFGLPVTRRDNGDRARWVYPRNVIVLFENDIVYRVIE